ncbi:MAG: hypothetical protein ABUS47_06600 [Steroidobacter sp.]
MPINPQAKFEIIASDQTKSAIASAINGLDTLDKKFKSFAKTAIAGFSVAGIAEQLKTAVDLGSQMINAAQQAGISVTQFSALAYATRQLGDVELPALSTAIKDMQVNLNNGSAVFQRLGLNFQDLKKLQPEQQFEMIADKINAIQEPAQRTAMAVQVFGKAGAELLPVFSQGADGIRQYITEAERLGVVVGTDQVEAIQRADEAIKKLSALWQTLWKDAAVGSVYILQQLGAIPKESQAQFNDLYSQFLAVKQNLDALKNPDWLTRTLNSTDTIKEHIKEYEQQLESLRKSMEALQSQANNGFKAPAPKYETINALTTAQQRALIDAKTAGTMQTFNQLSASFDAYNAKVDEAQSKTMTDVEKMNKDWADFQTNLKYLVDTGQIDATEALERIKAYNAATLTEVTVNLGKFEPMYQKKFDSMRKYAEEAARGVQDAFEQFFYDPAKDGLKGLLNAFLETFRRIIAEAAAAKAELLIFGNEDKSGHFSGGLISTFINDLTGKATGGPVSSGIPYLVGEKGPELFIPNNNGSIMTNQMLASTGGGMNVTNVFHVDARGATPDAIKLIPGAMKQASDNAVQRMFELKRRGKF